MEILYDCPNANESIHNVYEIKTKPEMIRYYHSEASFLMKRTWIRAIKCGKLVSWPGLTVDAAHKHFPESEETQKGHMQMQPQGLRSTKVPMVPGVLEEDYGEDGDIVPQQSKK